MTNATIEYSKSGGTIVSRGAIEETDKDSRRYANLEDICGGQITVDRLDIFRKAIPEFHLFIEMMGKLLAPLEDEDRGIPDASTAQPGRD
ncbi:hypothetical protein QA649_37490 [Bradyrhizobium sp. CB1717]|uniref:hypothetical protein n=1 Tax=Bradyrhizobium sp. CB1717 TaxID=3039154 RepID=UPI0024B12CBC|nr:hypothetical protein [Bradyrhizobium sp. CB1717]WFU23647.1 hypothetical protein QA649_37490 [Bradyrhizobium sp. CB1717]